ncbi:MAG: 16S rRNA (cytosine(967)-C(5))-methyltransferase RsmB [Vicinamibacterales bacterium]|nr:16S rRNA (cytosine(967)-C(5))-methyltransferase RsmB [Vicinamibacterales bacterium]
MSVARMAAYWVLRAVLEGEDLPRALVRERDSLADQRDRALVTELSTGTLRWLAALDYLIVRASGRPTSRLDPEVLAVVRLGAYQLLHLDRIPASAAVNESVNLAKRVGKASAAGLVNAVLRRVAKSADAPPLPPPPSPGASRADQVAYLSITGSHPAWLVERWLDRIGFARADAWISFNNRAAALTLRANRRRITVDDLRGRLAEHGVSTTPTRWARDGLSVVSGHPLRTPLADEGLFVVQEEASQLVAELVAARPGERVLDACAAPGGKTTALDAGLDEDSLLVAAELGAPRVALLRRLVRATGAEAVRFVRHDLRHAPFLPVFDCVLVDSPCSGLGTVRRDPEIRWRRQPEDLSRMAALQRTLLRGGAAVVRPGGRLVYATCSSEPEENEEVVRTFLADHPQFESVHPEVMGPVRDELRSVITAEGCLTTTPDEHGLELFFAAILRRRQD